jgi:hypothetical protein
VQRIVRIVRGEQPMGLSSKRLLAQADRLTATGGSLVLRGI